MASDFIQNDLNRTRAILRGEHDSEILSAVFDTPVCVASEALVAAASKNHILKMDGQRGMSANGGLQLIELLAKEAPALPSYDDVVAEAARG